MNYEHTAQTETVLRLSHGGRGGLGGGVLAGGGSGVHRQEFPRGREPRMS